MEFVFLMLFLFVLFAIMGSDKKKSKMGVSGGQGNSPSGSAPDWSRYDAAEQGGGLQDEGDSFALYDASAARVEAARKAAAAKLSYNGMPTTGMTPKNKGRTIKSGRSLIGRSAPLVRDMNIQRRLFLSGGRNNAFGERAKKRFGSKTLLGFVVLGVVSLYVARAIGS